jgi:hypothetical protein
VKAQIVSETEHSVPWNVGSGIEVIGVLIPDLDNLLLRIQDVEGERQLLSFPRHKPGKNFKVIGEFEIDKKISEKIKKFSGEISLAISYLKLQTILHSPREDK